MWISPKERMWFDPGPKPPEEYFRDWQPCLEKGCDSRATNNDGYYINLVGKNGWGWEGTCEECGVSSRYLWTWVEGQWVVSH